MATHPVFLPGESHGQRTLVGYSPQGHRVGHDWVTNTYTQWVTPKYCPFFDPFYSILKGNFPLHYEI